MSCYTYPPWPSSISNQAIWIIKCWQHHVVSSSIHLTVMDLSWPHRSIALFANSSNAGPHNWTRSLTVSHPACRMQNDCLQMSAPGCVCFFIIRVALRKCPLLAGVFLHNKGYPKEMSAPGCAYFLLIKVSLRKCLFLGVCFFIMKVTLSKCPVLAVRISP